MSNKYYNWYHAIINNKKEKSVDINEYQEIHHILPRSIGGSNDLENLIALSSREHFVCHYLLTKMYPVGTCEWYKMQHAFMMMAAQHQLSDSCGAMPLISNSSAIADRSCARLSGLRVRA